MNRLVAAFRAWLSGRGGGGPVPVTQKKDLLPEHELLDHYNQHVRHCPSCSKVPPPVAPSTSSLACHCGGVCTVHMRLQVQSSTAFSRPPGSDVTRSSLMAEPEKMMLRQHRDKVLMEPE